MITINSQLCNGCGRCAQICPRHVTIIEQVSGDSQAVVATERENLCINCGQCAAICKQGAIVVDGLDPAGFAPVVDPGVDYEQLLAVLKQRRAIRRYKKTPVPRDVLEKILEAVAVTPAVSGSGVIGVSVITGGDKIRGLTQKGYELYGQLAKKLKNPFIRFIMKGKAGPRKVHMLENFVMPAMAWYEKWFDEDGIDEIRRDSPVVMLFHCPKLEPSGDEACMLAAFHAVLAVQTLGLGTCINGLFPPFVNRDPQIRKSLDIPEANEVYAAITLGYPKIQFNKTIPRKLGQVKFIEWGD